MSRSERSKAAYTLVDLSGLPAEIRQDVQTDALAGGGEYGIRVVEEIHNGAARAQIFGVYNGEDAEKWEEAKKNLGISSDEIDDSEVNAATAEANPRTEAALRQAAEQRANAEAEAARTTDDENVRKVLEGDSDVPANSPNRQQPNNNIADATLAKSNDKGSKHKR